MPILKNVAGQKLAVFAWDSVNEVPKTGDAANISAQISKDFGAAAATNDAAPTELDATDHPGIYLFDLTQAESNADDVIVTPVSATANIVLDPVWIKTRDLSLDGVVAFGTAQSASASGIVVAASEAFADDVKIGMTLAVRGADQGYWQARLISDNALTGDALTVSPNWTVTPSGAPIEYRIYASAPGASLADIAGAIRTELTTELDEIGAILVDTGTTLNDKIDIIDGNVDDIETLLGLTDTDVEAIKTKTDSLTFTVAGEVDTNVQSINDAALEGDGDATPWGPA